MNDLKPRYEELSGNTVEDGWVVDSNGHKVARYSDEMAKNYINISEECT
jgi:hypothetical protein